mmetsp:Transcript_85615/g.223452  ORF Transcript_85615/g.223452 Transcript_85615/m.223452 type:complete len:203 (+) Transcript_85615:1040-1648(+)
MMWSICAGSLARVSCKPTKCGAGGAIVAWNCTEALRDCMRGSSRTATLLSLSCVTGTEAVWTSEPSSMTVERLLIVFAGGVRGGDSDCFFWTGCLTVALALCVASRIASAARSWPMPGKRASRANWWSTWSRPRKSESLVTLLTGGAGRGCASSWTLLADACPRRGSLVGCWPDICISTSLYCVRNSKPCLISVLRSCTKRC